MGWFQALVTAPWIHPDERAHTGYVMALARGDLPSIDTAIEVPEGARDLATVLEIQRAANEAAGTTSRDTVWVANHPPGPYLLALPGTWWAIHTGRGYAVLGWLRALNVVGLALAVGFTALLARELTGRSWVGAVASGLCAGTPYLSRASALGLTDGFALAAMVAAVWSAARAHRRGFDRTATAVVATVVLACGLTRRTALVTAVLVVGLALTITCWQQRTLRWRAAVAVAAPVGLLTGWFYALNVHRYGDPAGSAALLKRFERTSVGSVAEVATDPSYLLTTLRTLAVGRLDRSFSDPGASPWPAPGLAADLVLVGVALAAAFLAATAWASRGGRGPTGTRPTGLGWLLLGAAVVANWVMMAQHVSGGGLPHSRYLALAVPAGCVTVAAALDRARRSSLPAEAALVTAAIGHNLVGLAAVVELSRRAGPYERARLGSATSAQAMTVGIAVAVATTAAGFIWRHRADPLASPDRDSTAESPLGGAQAPEPAGTPK